MSRGVGCLGSPIDRLIARFAGSGTTPAYRPRRRSNGYGCSRASLGFTRRVRAELESIDYSGALQTTGRAAGDASARA